MVFIYYFIFLAAYFISKKNDKKLIWYGSSTHNTFTKQYIPLNYLPPTKTNYWKDKRLKKKINNINLDI